MTKEEIEEAKVEEAKSEEAKPEPQPEPVEKPPEPAPEPTEKPQEPKPTPVAEQPIAVEKGEATKAQIDKIVKTGRYYTIKDFAKELNYSEGRIRSLVIAGRIKAIKPTGSTWRIPPSEVERVKTEGIPPMPREKPEIEAGEIIVIGKHAERVEPKPKEEAKESKYISLVDWLFHEKEKEE